MSQITNMRQLLSDRDEFDTPLSSQEKETLLNGHIETTNVQSTNESRLYQEALQALLAQSGTQTPERAGHAIIRSLRASRLLFSAPTPSYEAILQSTTHCTTLDAPRLTLQSAKQEVRNEAGNIVRFTRANTSTRTLEVAAATGEFGGVRWPPSNAFLVGCNRSQASIEGILAIPAHGQGSVLTVFVQLGVEQILYGGGTISVPASSLLATLQGDGNLPLRGTAVGWCRATLSLHGAQGSTTTSTEFVSKWVNRDGEGGEDHAPGGIINLASTVALGPETSALSVFVDIVCVAGAEESTSNDLLSAFTLFECRNKPVTEINGLYVAPSRLRIRQVMARLCELPVLVQSNPATQP